jgi:two-component system, LytTR family, response regulator
MEPKRLRALVIDDEEYARKNLIMMLDDFCPEIEVIGEASGKEQAKALITASKPDVIFLDIRMPSGAEGFELLEEVEEKNFLVVFVTAFKDYAIRAFNASAVYYLLKPIDIDDLRIGVEKLVEANTIFAQDPENYVTYFRSLRNLSDQLLRNKPNNRIAISHTKGLKIVEDNTISHLEASGNCTTIYFNDGTRYLDTRTLKIYENILNPAKFFRVHKSHIINLNNLAEYVNDDGHFAVLKAGLRIPVARNRVTDFVKMLKEG